MNKIYKVIWNKARGMYVVVSELAKRDGKARTIVGAKPVSALALAAVMAMMGTASVGAAQYGTDTFIYDALVNGKNKKVRVYIATESPDKQGSANSVVGTGVGLGYSASVDNDSAVAVGGYANAGKKSVAIGGAWNDGEIGKYNTRAGENAVAVGAGANASGKGAVVVGYRSSGTGTDAVVVGSGSSAAGANSTALGAGSSAAGVNSTAIGGGTTNSGNEAAISIGRGSQAVAVDAIALGDKAISKSQGEIAIGLNAGNGDNRTDALNAISIGSDAHAKTQNSIAIGNAAVASNGDGVTAGKAGNIAIGANAKAQATDGVAIGENATASGVGSVAIGKDSTTNGIGKGGFGYVQAGMTFRKYLAEVQADKNFAGNSETDAATRLQLQTEEAVRRNKAARTGAAWIDTDGIVSIGAANGTKTRRLSGLAAGYKDTDAVNVAQLRALSLNVSGDNRGDSSDPTGALHPTVGVNIVSKPLTLTGAGDKARSDAKTTSETVKVYKLGGGPNGEELGTWTEEKVTKNLTLDKDELTEVANLGTVISSDGSISVRLAKNVEGLETVEAGSAVLGQDKTDPTKTYLTGLSNLTWTPSTTPVSGRAATEDQLAASQTHYYSVKSSTKENNYNNDGATKEGALAAGVKALASGNYSMAIGYNAGANGRSSISMGPNAIAWSDNSVSIGTNTGIDLRSSSEPNENYTIDRLTNKPVKVTQMYNPRTADSVFIGTNAGASNIARRLTSATLDGYTGTLRDPNGILDTSSSTTANNGGLQNGSGLTYHKGYHSVITNGDELKSLDNRPSDTLTRIYLDGAYTSDSGERRDKYRYYSDVGYVLNDPINRDITMSGGADGAVAIGNNAKVVDHGVAIGDGAKVLAAEGVAIGYGSHRPGVANDKTTVASGYRSVAIGGGIASGKDTIAIGMNSKADREAGEVGAMSRYGVMATGATIDNLYSDAINVSVPGGVAGAGTSVKYGDRGKLLQYFTSNLGTFSVGTGPNGVSNDLNAQNLRMISGVAAGRFNTDAVNVAQLKSLTLGVKGDSNQSAALYDRTGLSESGEIRLDANGSLGVLSNGAANPSATMVGTTNIWSDTMYITGGVVKNKTNADGTIVQARDRQGFLQFDSAKTENLVNDYANIGTITNGSSVMLRLNKDLNLTSTGSTTIGNTAINNDGMRITGGPSITTGGINAGGKQITNVASGGDTVTNAANIGDVERISKANDTNTITDVAGTGAITVTPTPVGTTDISNRTYTVGVNYNTVAENLNLKYTGDNNTSGQNKLSESVAFNGTANQIVTKADNGKVGFALADDVVIAKTVTAGGAKVGTQAGGGANAGEGNYVTGLSNTEWNANNIASGRAATEDQLKKVADDIKNGTVAGDKYVTGGTATYADNGTGTAALTGTNGLTATVTGLHDYYITGATTSTDGKTVTLTKNGGDPITINLSNILKNDMRLVANPAAD
ncbi:ESPR-type extended signal peptide-containing protein, partial [Veillonella caviae]|uniref:ESPR-type extended signal peptide-containing protein n=1 Tax=Veillonella caviae TaxID=248316 RepID=UPI002354640D